MYVCMYVCMYVRIWTHTRTRICTCTIEQACVTYLCLFYPFLRCNHIPIPTCRRWRKRDLCAHGGGHIRCCCSWAHAGLPTYPPRNDEGILNVKYWDWSPYSLALSMCQLRVSHGLFVPFIFLCSGGKRQRNTSSNNCQRRSNCRHISPLFASSAFESMRHWSVEIECSI